MILAKVKVESLNQSCEHEKRMPKTFAVILIFIVQPLEI
jgi:hypothetical protein